MTNEQNPKQDTTDTDMDAFTQAVEHHRLMLAIYGENNPHALEALLVVMALSPDSLFAEIELAACSTLH